jgi:NAD(P)-dependent dehydrogenase (short-subunit alcohol dehydrogenase family)
MVNRETGSIVNISSIHGMIVAPGLAQCCAAKAGILGLMRTAAREVSPRQGCRTRLRLHANVCGIHLTPLVEARSSCRPQWRASRNHRKSPGSWPSSPPRSSKVNDQPQRRIRSHMSSERTKPVVVVTGAPRGIGAATVTELVRRGARVLAGRRRATVDRVAADATGEVITREVDVRNGAAVNEHDR